MTFGSDCFEFVHYSQAIYLNRNRLTMSAVGSDESPCIHRRAFYLISYAAFSEIILIL